MQAIWITKRIQRKLFITVVGLNNTESIIAELYTQKQDAASVG